MDKLDMAKALLGGQQKSGSQSGGQTTTAYGTAVGDSADGKVLVDFGGETSSYDDEQAVEVDTTFFVKEGDQVIVSLVGADGTGKAPVVTGVVGRGDQQQTEINSVTNYVWNDAAGLHVSTQERSVQGANILLDSDSLEIRKGASNSEADQTVYASFGGEVTVGSRRSGSAVGGNSVVIGWDCSATKAYSYAEGSQTKSIGICAHAEGEGTTAEGQFSHAEGYGGGTHGNYSHSEGYWTLAGSDYQHVQGRGNVADDYGVYCDIIGNGDSYASDPSNAYNMDWNGNAEFQGEVYVGGCTPNGETPYPVVRYNTSSSQSEYYNGSSWTQVPGGGGGGGAWTELWTNQNQTSNFAAQNVNVDITNYSVFMVQFRMSTSTTARLSMIVVKNDVNHMILSAGVILSSGSITMSVRYVKTNGNTGFTFDDAYRKTITSTSAGTVTNSQLIPTVIYGVC